LASDGNFYDRVDPKDSNSYNFTFGVLAQEHYEFGFLYGRQNSTLVISGTNDRDIGDFAVSNYHGYFAYNFGEPEAPIRPFVLIGFGATSSSSVDFTSAFGNGTINGNTKFSTTWSGGVKFYFSKNVGVKAAARWTPTYIKTDEAGWWCDPFWGCYVIGDAQYANQFELTGGVTVRF
jgi:opacity protein-like surface antigen